MTKIVKSVTWATGADNIHTKREYKSTFKLNEFSTSKEIEWSFHVDESELINKSIGYDMMICVDMMSELSLIINFRENIIDWEDIQIPMASTLTRFNNNKIAKSITIEYGRTSKYIK